jgi:hypothetical protein
MKLKNLIYSQQSSNFVRPSGRTLNKRLYIQRRLAWSLNKNDTHNRREANLFLRVMQALLLPMGCGLATFVPKMFLATFVVLLPKINFRIDSGAEKISMVSELKRHT